MRKIVNPWVKNEDTRLQCFGCSPYNNIGLNLEFFEDGEYLISEWIPKDYLQGYMGVLHGGIQATLLDEIASWVVYVKCKTGGVTSNLEIKYRSPVFINGSKIKIRAKLVEQGNRIATIQTELFNSEDKLCAEAEVKYFIFPEKIAKEKYAYPGAESFYEE